MKIKNYWRKNQVNSIREEIKALIDKHLVFGGTSSTKEGNTTVIQSLFHFDSEEVLDELETYINKVREDTLKGFVESLPGKHRYFTTAFESGFTIAETMKLAKEYLQSIKEQDK